MSQPCIFNFIFSFLCFLFSLHVFQMQFPYFLFFSFSLFLCMRFLIAAVWHEVRRAIPRSEAMYIMRFVCKYLAETTTSDFSVRWPSAFIDGLEVVARGDLCRMFHCKFFCDIGGSHLSAMNHSCSLENFCRLRRGMFSVFSGELVGVASFGGFSSML